ARLPANGVGRRGQRPGQAVGLLRVPLTRLPKILRRPVLLAQEKVGPPPVGGELPAPGCPLDGLPVVVKGLLPSAQPFARAGAEVIGVGVCRVPLQLLRTGADDLLPGGPVRIDRAGLVEVGPAVVILPKPEVKEAPLEVSRGTQLV